MKTSSIATRAILASGQYLKAELYEIEVGATTYRYTTADVPLRVSGQDYATNLVIRRGSVLQKLGTEVQSLELNIAPVFDDVTAAPLISGVPFLTAVRRKELDNARITLRKIFLNTWDDTSPGAVFWFQGRVNDARAGRSSAQINVNQDIELLNISMPRNLYQPGCVHTVFDAGCQLVEASFTVTGTVTGSPTISQFTSNRTEANGHFSLGRIRFTSGVNNGLRRTVKLYANSGGTFTLVTPLPSPPAPGDTFAAVPGCDKQQATCSSAKFNNLVHFRGYPYIPVPETLYAGGTSSDAIARPGTQGGGGGGGGSRSNANQS